MINLEQQNELFKLIGEILKDKLECYVIGGSAMMYYGMKGNTKDIDLVFEHEKDREKVGQSSKERNDGVIHKSHRSDRVSLGKGNLT